MVAPGYGTLCSLIKQICSSDNQRGHTLSITQPGSRLAPAGTKSTSRFPRNDLQKAWAPSYNGTQWHASISRINPTYIRPWRDPCTENCRSLPSRWKKLTQQNRRAQNITCWGLKSTDIRFLRLEGLSIAGRLNLINLIEPYTWHLRGCVAFLWTRHVLLRYLTFR